MITQKLMALTLCLMLNNLLLTTYSFGQTADKTEAVPTQKTNEADALPDFRFYTATDSVLVTSAQLNANKPILFFYFSTKCPYCQDMTKEITQMISALKDVQIVMVSGHRRVSITKYAAQFELEKYPIWILKDDEKQMHNYFDYAAVPMVRLYDKNKRLIHRQEGKISVQNILSIFKNHE
jgi:peroxiredoxin